MRLINFAQPPNLLERGLTALRRQVPYLDTVSTSPYPIQLQTGIREVNYSPSQNKIQKSVKTYRQSSTADINKERDITTKAAELGISPKIHGTYKHKDNYGFVQDYGGEGLNSLVDKQALTPKQLYYLGHRTARQRNRLLNEGGILHTDLAPRNIVIKDTNKNKPTSQLIDYNNAVENASIDTLNKHTGYGFQTNELSTEGKQNPFMAGYDLRRDFQYMTYLINFGNPLNKIKKNDWWVSEGKKVDVPFTDGLKYTNLDDIKRAARTKIDDEIELGNIAALDNSTNKLNNISSKKIKTSPDYTDVRYDDASEQYVGFPRVNGYMEVPIGSGTKELFDDDFNHTLAGAYVYKKAQIPNRKKDPRQVSGIDNLFDFTFSNKSAFFGNPLNKIKKNNWLDSLGMPKDSTYPYPKSMTRKAGRAKIDAELNTAREATVNKTNDKLDISANVKQAQQHIPGKSVYMDTNNKFTHTPTSTRARLDEGLDDNLQRKLTAKGKYLESRNNMVPKRK